MFNRAGRIARGLGFDGRLKVDRMIASAKRKTGLSDFGDEWFMEPLQVLTDSINAEADLTPLGNMLQNVRMVSALATRLHAQRLLRENPEIVDASLGKIIVIAGLQRTGTTALHRLLGADPDMRELRSWETLNPLPVSGEDKDDPKRRIRQAKFAEKAMRFMAPEFFAVHPIEYDAPEEDIFLLDLSFMSQAPEATMHVPTYAKWLEKQDHSRSYEYMYTMLKLLHWQRPGKNWVLKTPHHMEHLDVILNVFPEVFVVQTHRDPKKSMASFFSMVAHARGMLSDHVDPGEVAEHWMRKSRRLMERSINVRESSECSNFIDISYYDLIDNPIREVRRVYETADIPFWHGAEVSAERAAERNTKDRYGKHVYRLDSFNLDETTIDEYCDFYRRTYRIPDEKDVFSKAV